MRITCRGEKTFHCIERLVRCAPQSLTLCQDKYFPVSGGRARGLNQCFTYCHAPRCCWVLYQVITVTLRGEKLCTETTSWEPSLSLPDKATSVRVISGRLLCLFSMGIVTWAYFNRLNYADTLQSPWIYHLHPSPGSATKAITSLGPNQ